MRDKSTTTPAKDDLGRSLAVFTARRQFLDATIGMSWQLALTIVLPVIIGVKLDEHFDTMPSYTLAALILGVTGGIMVVSKTIKNVNREQAEEARKKKII